MVVKTIFTPVDFARILSQYNLGDYTTAEPLQQGTVQTNYILFTSHGKYIFRYYESRSMESVLFESQLLTYLTENAYPCPVQCKNILDGYVSTYLQKPYVIFEFIEGQPIEQPNENHKQQLIQKAAELQRLGRDFHSAYTPHRWNYTPDLCSKLAEEKAKRINTNSAYGKLSWLDMELENLNLPPSLPKGICHCDFHFSNILFQHDTFIALLDFDDANYTFMQFDLVGLIEYWAWTHTDKTLNMKKARNIVQAYMRYRPLSPIEQYHMIDVYKLSILFDCVWYFERGISNDFYEKRKIDTLTGIGRQRFINELFKI